MASGNTSLGGGLIWSRLHDSLRARLFFFFSSNKACVCVLGEGENRSLTCALHAMELSITAEFFLIVE